MWYPSGDWGKVFLYLEANATSAIFAEGNLQHRLEWLVQSLTRSLGWNMELTCLFSYRYKDAVMFPPTTYLEHQSPAAKVNLPTLSRVLGEVMSPSTRWHTRGVWVLCLSEKCNLSRNGYFCKFFMLWISWGWNYFFQSCHLQSSFFLPLISSALKIKNNLKRGT